MSAQGTADAGGAVKNVFSVFNVTALGLLVAALLAQGWVARPPAKPETPTYILSERVPVSVPVYYVTPAGRLTKEERNVPVVQGDQNKLGMAEAALTMWAQGPGSAELRALIPAGTPAPKVWLRGDNYFVSLPAAYRQLGYSASGEYQMLCSVTRTLLETHGLDVTFLVDGKNVTTLNYMDLRQPLNRQDCKDQPQK